MALPASGIGIADGGGERERGFLRLRGRGEGSREAGEIVETEAVAPDFGAQLVEGLLGGEGVEGEAGIHLAQLSQLRGYSAGK